jgi:hypothetical protein
VSNKTPVLQVGADIYRDTALIADVLSEHLQSEPICQNLPRTGMARTLATTDTTLFWTAMAHTICSPVLPTRSGRLT